MEKTSTGLDENIAGLLCYVLGWVSGIVFILIERENKFVRFHAIQSIVVFGVLTVAGNVLGWIPWIGIVFFSIISILIKNFSLAVQLLKQTYSYAPSHFLFGGIDNALKSLWLCLLFKWAGTGNVIYKAGWKSARCHVNPLF